MKNIKISITGDLGSGKTTVGNIIKEHYNLNMYSAGSIQRMLAQKYGMDVLEFNKYMEEHTEIDNEIDKTLEEIGRRDEDMLLDSRMAWHFVPDSFKVFLSVDPAVAAERIYQACRGSIETYSSPEEALQKIIQRKASENYRYKTFYGVDCANMDNYDLVVDTSDRTPQEVAEIIINAFDEYRKNNQQS